MTYLFRIACRNLTRNKFRTFISILAIATSVMIVVLARGLLMGFVDSTYSLYVNNISGHVQLVARDYQPRRSLLTLEYPVDGFQGGGLTAMVEEIKQLEGVKQVLPRLQFGAMASPKETVVRMNGIGVDPEAETHHGVITEDIVEGRMVESGREIVAGRGLLQELGLELGDRVTIVFSDYLYSMRGVTFEIVGVRETGITGFDDFQFYLPLSEAQQMLYLEDSATEILVMGESTRTADQLAARIDGLIAGYGDEDYYTALTWEQTDPMMQAFQVAENIYDIIYLFFILLGCFVVFNTMMMIVRDRTEEIGMMGALGLRGKSIMAVFTIEGAIKGVLGSLLGLIPGGVLTYYLSQVGLDYYDQMLEHMEELVFAPVIYPVFSLENLIFSFVLGAVVTTLACLWPAVRAARMEPVDALHHEM